MGSKGLGLKALHGSGENARERSYCPDTQGQVVPSYLPAQKASRVRNLGTMANGLPKSGHWEVNAMRAPSPPGLFAACPALSCSSLSPVMLTGAGIYLVPLGLCSRIPRMGVHLRGLHGSLPGQCTGFSTKQNVCWSPSVQSGSWRSWVSESQGLGGSCQVPRPQPCLSCVLRPPPLVFAVELWSLH